MFWETLKAARDLGRLHEITSILLRYGFSDVVKRLGMSHVLEQAGKVLKWKGAERMARMETHERVRRAIEEIGSTYIKLGQIMATRVDLFPPEWIAELEKLQDRVPPQAFEKLTPQLEEDLGAPPEEVFAHIDTCALAAGSIAQVHRATLDTGEQVILKIRHPGSRRIMEADLRILSRLADIAEKQIPEAKHFHPKDLVRQLTLSLRRELDLATECRHAERIAANFSEDPNILIPKVYWQYTSERINVQEYIDGIPGRDMKGIENAGLNRKLLAERGVNSVLKMILEDGFYHADPHPGNLFYLPGNRIAYIDLGMVGRLPRQRREQVIDLIRGLVEPDSQLVVDVLSDWAGDSHVNENELVMEVDTFIENYHSVSLKNIDFPAMLAELTTIMRDNNLTLPADLVLLIKTFITLEGLGRQLDPDYDMVNGAKPVVNRLVLARYSPKALAKRGWGSLSSIVNILTDLPSDIRRLLKSARSGSLQLNVEITRLDLFGKELDRAASRVTIGLVTAALIIGSSIVMTVKGGPTIFGLPLLGFMGFVGAGIGGLWVIISVWRSGRDNL
ncbi:MAG: ABC1 kinase family protein [Thiohalomonadales bacterium]